MHRPTLLRRIATGRTCRPMLRWPSSRSRWSSRPSSGWQWLAGVATATGTALAGADLRLTEALAGVLNIVPVAVLCLGAAQVAIGWAPQAVLALGAAPAVGGFMLTVLVDTFDGPNWLAQLSPFAHLAWVPTTAPDWAGAAGMIGVSVLLAGLGIAGFARRDLRG